MAASDMERFWLLVALQLDNEASADELRELSLLLQDNPEWQDLLAQARQASAISAAPLQLPDADRSLNRHIQRLSNPPPPQPEQAPKPEPAKPARLRKIALFAGSIAASLLLVFFITRHTSRPAPTTANVISTRFGSKSRVQLPDGTQ